MASIILIDHTMARSEEILKREELPDNYMGDYSVLGFVVDRYIESVNILGEAGYRLQDRAAGTAVHFDDAAAVPRIQALLLSHGIAAVFRDIAEPYYQA